MTAIDSPVSTLFCFGSSASSFVFAGYVGDLRWWFFRVFLGCCIEVGLKTFSLEIVFSIQRPRGYHSHAR